MNFGALIKCKQIQRTIGSFHVLMDLGDEIVFLVYLYLYNVKGLIIRTNKNRLTLKIWVFFARRSLTILTKASQTLKIFVIYNYFYIVDKSFIVNNNPFIFSAVRSDNLNINVSHDGSMACFFPKSTACFNTVSSLGHTMHIIHRNYVGIVHFFVNGKYYNVTIEI